MSHGYCTKALFTDKAACLFPYTYAPYVGGEHHVYGYGSHERRHHYNWNYYQRE